MVGKKEEDCLRLRPAALYAGPNEEEDEPNPSPIPSPPLLPAVLCPNPNVLLLIPNTELLDVLERGLVRSKLTAAALTLSRTVSVGIR